MDNKAPKITCEQWMHSGRTHKSWIRYRDTSATMQAAMETFIFSPTTKQVNKRTEKRKRTSTLARTLGAILNGLWTATSSLDGPINPSKGTQP